MRKLSLRLDGFWSALEIFEGNGEDHQRQQDRDGHEEAGRAGIGPAGLFGSDGRGAGQSQADDIAGDAGDQRADHLAHPVGQGGGVAGKFRRDGGHLGIGGQKIHKAHAHTADAHAQHDKKDRDSGRHAQEGEGADDYSIPIN